MNKKVTLTILVFAFLICAGSASGFVTRKDPHGFSLECPEGWGVRVIGRGCIVVGKDVENMMDPMAWIWPVTLKEAATTKNVMDSMVTILKKSYPDLEILSLRKLSTVQGTVALKFTYSDRGTKVKGKIIIFTQLIRPPGMPSGLWQANALLCELPRPYGRGFLIRRLPNGSLQRREFGRFPPYCSLKYRYS